MVYTGVYDYFYNATGLATEQKMVDRCAKLEKEQMKLVSSLFSWQNEANKLKFPDKKSRDKFFDGYKKVLWKKIDTLKNERLAIYKKIDAFRKAHGITKDKYGFIVRK